MMIEAVQQRLVSPANVAQKLARRPQVVRRLATYEVSLQAIPSLGIEIATLTETTILQTVRHQRRYGLLTNDSLIVATMLQQGVRILASADRRLAGVTELEIVGPGDLASPGN
ncbi:MAG: PIN domain-containing protein [Deltaproteobacteria bacterium]|nr:PIN domain-containing protein [Deltaproteobacteria bacterium]